MTAETRSGRGADAISTCRFATLNFTREIDAPLSVLWQAWTAPAARAVWSAHSPSVSVEFEQADTRIGGREVAICRTEGEAELRCESVWLELQQERCGVNCERISSAGETRSAALVTAEFSSTSEGSQLSVTVQLASIARDMEADYRQGFDAGLDQIAAIARRTMIMQRVIRAPRHIVWNCWMNPEALPQWWGPDGYSCRTQRIDLRTGGEWVFDMIAPDGQIFPNHHRYSEVWPEERIAYSLLWGENGPKHADAWASFEDLGGATRVTLGMIFVSPSEYEAARNVGAYELGLQTLGKLERFVEAARSQ